MIEVQHLTKRYGPFTAVDDVSFRVEKGQILGFLGPNGAGKTTTMRVLTGYMPASEGSATVAGYDVFTHPIEAKRRIGYLPETPPLYPDMTVREYLTFVAKLKLPASVSKAEREARIDGVMAKTHVADMAKRHCSKLSKGYKQRVGLAQALLHDPEVLILDEPTAGLDPKQIIETRDLIRGLAGNHTIVLSTHILPEVSQTCSRVVIINKGRVVAVDTPDNLTRQLKGAATLYVQVDAAGADAAAALAQVPGVRGVSEFDRHDHLVGYELTAETDRDIRRDVARSVVDKGWGLLELRPLRMSLEDIFLQLTTDESGKPVDPADQPPPARCPMRNILTIAGKELRGYFVSPMGWVVMGLFALLFGYFFIAYLEVFVQRSMQSSMGGGPVNVNQDMIRGVLGNASVLILFLLPMITMRAYAEEKRSGTIELLLTSPVTDIQIVAGKFLGALGFYAALLAVTLLDIAILFIFGNPEWKPVLTGYVGLLLMGSCFISIGLFVSSTTKNQVVAGAATFVVALLLWIISWLGSSFGPNTAAVLSYLSITEHFDDFSKGVIDTKHVIYYASVIAFGLFLTVKSVDTERWRG